MNKKAAVLGAMTMNTKVQIEISGDMIDGFAEIIMGVLFMTGLLIRRTLTKRKNPDGSYTLILRLETKKPPLGSLGLKDIPDEE